MKLLSPARCAVAGAVLVWLAPVALHAQQPLGWAEVKARFEASNPALRADALNVDEQKAAETTAFLRPNPQFTFSTDGTQIAPNKGVWQPLTGTQYQSSLSYLHERDNKRELRLKAAQQGTDIAHSQHEDLKRNLEFNLRTAFIGTLEAKAIVALAQSDLVDYDKIIAISQARFHTGDLAQIDLDRIELLRVQYESELETAHVNLRSAKIQLLQLLNDRTPVEQFDVTGSFAAPGALGPLDDFHTAALESRPDLAAAIKSIEQSQTNHQLAVSNGSTDPTFSGWYTYNSSFSNPNLDQSLGLSVSVPLRIFDRNQGEKKRTAIDVDRNRQLADAQRAQVFSDVDSAYVQLDASLRLLAPYQSKYKAQALRVRDTVTYAWQHGGASLLDLLNAESDYRTVQLAYLQLIGNTLNAASQLNLACGREVIQ